MKNTKPGNCPQVKSCKTGNLPYYKAGDAPGASGSAGGKMKDGGSYKTGSDPGTVKAK
jgi:hypothetical protein